MSQQRAPEHRDRSTGSSRGAGQLIEKGWTVYDALERATHRLCDGLEQAARDAGVAFTTTRSCAMFGLYFTDQYVDTYAKAVACDTSAFNRFFHAMLQRGVYLAPSAFEAGFVSAQHDDAILRATLDAARKAFAAA